MTPEAEPRLQTFRVTPVGDPSPALVAAAERLLARGGRSPRPPGRPTSPRGDALDLAAVERALRAGVRAVRGHAPGPPDRGRRPA